MTAPNFVATTESDDGYHALGRAAAWIDRGDRIRLEISGPDRAKFLHNLTTNDVKRLDPSRGREAFVTNPHGKTLSYITYLMCEKSILVRTEAAALSPLLTHLRKYSIFDNVEIEEASGRLLEYHIAGPRAEELVRSFWGLLPPDPALSHATTTYQGSTIRIVRESPTGRPGLTLLAPRSLETIIQDLMARLGGSHGLKPLSPVAYEAARIEAGTPCSGRDVVAGNLPQEIGRDRLAIDFAKGCYLGQETVARLDALGHVNKILVGLRFAGDPPLPDDACLWSGDKSVGTITSAAYSPGWKCLIGLAMVRTAQATPGTKLGVGPTAGDAREAEVAALPMLPGGD